MHMCVIMIHMRHDPFIDVSWDLSNAVVSRQQAMTLNNITTTTIYYIQIFEIHTNQTHIYAHITWPIHICIVRPIKYCDFHATGHDTQQYKEQHTNYHHLLYSNFRNTHELYSHICTYNMTHSQLNGETCQILWFPGKRWQAFNKRPYHFVRAFKTIAVFCHANHPVCVRVGVWVCVRVCMTWRICLCAMTQL